MHGKTILIAAGGTGGHVFPGLAIAHEFEKHGYTVQWLGTEDGMESRLVPINSIKLLFFPVYGFRGKSFLTKLLSPYRVAVSIYKAWKILRDVKPALVVGMGGFVAGPSCFAAYLSGIPVAIHEQNAIPGTTNKILSHFARLTFSAFPVDLKGAQVIGNPVRETLENLEKNTRDINVPGEKLRVLVVGGSRGARALNTMLPAALVDAGVREQIVIRHQCGTGREQETESAYAGTQLEVEVLPFIDDMDQAMAWADVMVCRAGALTVSEISVVGLPAVLIPYPYAIDNHQTANAQFLASAGAAYVVQESEFDSGMLTKVLEHVINDRHLIIDMSNKASKAAKRGAAKQFVDQCTELIK